jgi:hypothetical protein
VLPRVAFTDDEREAETMGRRIATEALHALADRLATPVRVERKDERSVMQISAYRRVQHGAVAPELATARRRVEFPLLPHPSLDYVRSEREKWDAELDAARADGDVGRVKVARYHVQWADKVEPALRAGTAPTSIAGWIHAVRIGDGVIATGPGETFSEIGMAVKERGPGRPTLYLGYTNGLASYFPTAAEYEFGGYEADYGCRSFGRPSHVAPECEQILVENAVRTAEELFPGAEPWDGSRGWVATGEVPALAPPPPLLHPSHTEAGVGAS